MTRMVTRPGASTTLAATSSINYTPVPARRNGISPPAMGQARESSFDWLRSTRRARKQAPHRHGGLAALEVRACLAGSFSSTVVWAAQLVGFSCSAI